MFECAINNEMTEGLNLPPFLTNNPYIEDMSVMAESILTKLCTKCQLEKPVTEFYRNTRERGGLQYKCKDCFKQYSHDNSSHIAAYKENYQEENREKIAVYRKQYREENKIEVLAREKHYRDTHNEEKAERDKRYRQTNKEKLREYWKEHYKKYKKRTLKYHREYYQQNKERLCLYQREYRKTKEGNALSNKLAHIKRARKYKATIENFNNEEVFERDRYKCQLCGAKTRPDYKDPNHFLYPNLDHIVPLSLGGEHSKRNTQCLCHRCNMVKHNTGTGDQLRMFG